MDLKCSENQSEVGFATICSIKVPLVQPENLPLNRIMKPESLFYTYTLYVVNINDSKYVNELSLNIKGNWGGRVTGFQECSWENIQYLPVLYFQLQTSNQLQTSGTLAELDCATLCSCFFLYFPLFLILSASRHRPTHAQLASDTVHISHTTWTVVRVLHSEFLRHPLR